MHADNREEQYALAVVLLGVRIRYLFAFHMLTRHAASRSVPQEPLA